MNNEKENDGNKIKEFCKLIPIRIKSFIGFLILMIVYLLPVAFMICIIILIFNNIHDCIAWILLICGSIVVITMIVCNTYYL